MIANMYLFGCSSSSVIPLTAGYWLEQLSFHCRVRMISLAAQKFISDIANDALQHCKMRGSGQSSRKSGKVSSVTILIYALILSLFILIKSTYKVLLLYLLAEGFCVRQLMDHNLLDFVTDTIWLWIHLSHQQVINWTTDEFTTNIINFLRKWMFVFCRTSVIH